MNDCKKILIIAAYATVFSAVIEFANFVMKFL